MLGVSSAEGTTCESMGCKSHVSETTSLKVPTGMTGVIQKRLPHRLGYNPLDLKNRPLTEFR